MRLPVSEEEYDIVWSTGQPNEIASSPLTRQLFQANIDRVDLSDFHKPLVCRSKISEISDRQGAISFSGVGQIFAERPPDLT
ncbi:hypothetical protein TNCV_4685691 [Trichonephila clavipes]|nr:hypothetical protein TNCV_4685691 [Trichonephila clavipes]